MIKFVRFKNRWGNAQEVNGNDQSITVTELENNKRYHFRVTPTNGAGSGTSLQTTDPVLVRYAAREFINGVN